MKNLIVICDNMTSIDVMDLTKDYQQYIDNPKSVMDYLDCFDKPDPDNELEDLIILGLFND